MFYRALPNSTHCPHWLVSKDGHPNLLSQDGIYEKQTKSQLFFIFLVPEKRLGTSQVPASVIKF